MAGTSSLPCFLHLVEAMHAGGRFFGDAAPVLHDLVPETGLSAWTLLEQILDDLLFVGAARRVDPVVAFFEFVAFVDEQRHVAAVIDDELRAFAFAGDDGLRGAVPVFFERLALPGEDRDAGLGDGGGGVVLRGEDVAARPAHVAPRSTSVSMSTAVWMVMCSEPVTRTPLSGLLGAYFLRMDIRPGISCSAMCDFLAAPIGEGEVCDFEVLFARRCRA